MRRRPGRAGVFSATLREPRASSSSPPKTLSWQALNYLHSPLCLNCSNMLEVDQTERLLFFFFFFFRSTRPTRASPRGLLGIRHENRGKEQRLVGTVKDVWTRAAHQNSFGETGMKYPPTASASQTRQNSTSVWQRIWCQNRETRSLLLLQLKPINIFSAALLSTNASQTFSQTSHFK